MRTKNGMLVAAALAGLAFAAPAAAQDGTVGTVVIAHGGDARWNARVLEVAAKARTGGPVEVSFLMGPGAAEGRFQDVVASLAAKGVRAVVVVPLLVSSHSGHYEQIRYLAGATDSLSEVMRHHLHMSGIERPASGVPIRLTPALDAAPEVARVLTDRARAIATTPAEEAVTIVGHGPNGIDDLAAWMENLRAVADSVRVHGGFRDVRVGLVQDDAPAAVRAEAVRRTRDLIELQATATGRPVLVVPVLISSGSVSRSKLPTDLAGLDVRYGEEPLLPHDAVARWIEGRVRDALANDR
jgi:sirohydrochlorin cobaltochelatase